MRIAYLSSGYPPRVGGVERHVAELATRMAADGHAVAVLAEEADSTLPRTELVDGVTVQRFPSRPRAGKLRAAAAVATRLAARRVGYDLVHAHNYHALPALAGALAGVRPLVFTPHYLGAGNSPVLRLLHAGYRPFGRLAFRRADRVICVSRAEAALIRQHFPRLKTPISVVPNGVDVRRLRDAHPHPVGGTPVLSAGRLEAYKNVGLAVRAMAHLDPDFSLYIAGDGADRPRLERLGRDLGVQGRIVFLGRLAPAELHRWYRTAKVYVTVSPRECFGITLLEALTAGTGVVASDIPAHREVIEESAAHTASLLPPSSTPEALAHTVREVARRADAEVVVTNPPSWDVVAEEHLKIYGSLRRG